MALPHFHVTEILPEYSEGDKLDLLLSRDILLHMNTLRIKAKERFVLLDAAGHADTFELLESGAIKLALAEPALGRLSLPATIKVRFCERKIYHRPINLTLVQGICVGTRMDTIIRQITELGVARIVPLENERSTVRLNPSNRAEKQARWQRIAASAADQATCAFVPEVTLPCDLAYALKLVSGVDLILVAWEEYKQRGIRSVVGDAQAGNPLKNIVLIIGSEGGFQEDEIMSMCGAGAIPVSLGETILRSETAAVAASALLLHELGGLGNVEHKISPCPLQGNSEKIQDTQRDNRLIP